MPPATRNRGSEKATRNRVKSIFVEKEILSKINTLDDVRSSIIIAEGSGHEKFDFEDIMSSGFIKSNTFTKEKDIKCRSKEKDIKSIFPKFVRNSRLKLKVELLIKKICVGGT